MNKSSQIILGSIITLGSTLLPIGEAKADLGGTYQTQQNQANQETQACLVIRNESQFKAFGRSKVEYQYTVYNGNVYQTQLKVVGYNNGNVYGGCQLNWIRPLNEVVYENRNPRQLKVEGNELSQYYSYDAGRTVKRDVLGFRF